MTMIVICWCLCKNCTAHECALAKCTLKHLFLIEQKNPWTMLSEPASVVHLRKIEMCAYA